MRDRERERGREGGGKGCFGSVCVCVCVCVRARERERERAYKLLRQCTLSSKVRQIWLHQECNGITSIFNISIIAWAKKTKLIPFELLADSLPYKCERARDSWAEKPYLRCPLRLPWLPVQGNSRLWSAGYVNSHSMVFAFRAQEFVLPLLSLPLSVFQ